MFSKFTISRIYAKAIFDLSIQYKNRNQWNSILSLLSKISQDTLVQSLCFYTLNTKKLSDFLIAVFEDCNNTELSLFGRNFIYIIVKNHRILLLPIIFEEFNNFYDNYMKFAVIEVISARKLNDHQLNEITEIMTHRLSKKVRVVCHINKNILAGIIIKIGNTIIDGSLTGRILRLRNILQF